MDQDVVYIITPEERAAYLTLSSDAARKQFVEQFWRKRDPNPKANGIEDEHYRRIEYANMNYSSAFHEGWQSDRGRMYILYGSPDEVESFPPQTERVDRNSTRNSLAREVWRYKYIDGLGVRLHLTFVGEWGEFHLAPGNGR